MDATDSATPVQEAPVLGASAPAAPAATPTKPYEFSRSSLLSPGELHKFRADHEEWLSALATRLAIHFRLECELTLAALETPTFRQFAGKLTSPAHLTLFKIEPLRGICVLEINPQLGLAMTDRLMGGPGKAVGDRCELSEIEISMLDQIVQLVTGGWCAHWNDWQALKPTLLGHENEPRYLQTSPPDSSLLLIKVNARLGESSGQMQLAIPFATIEPLVQMRRAELQPATDEAAAPSAPPPVARWNPAFDDVQVSLSAELPGPQLSAREVSRLQAGQVLLLPEDAISRAQLVLGGKAGFAGQLGTSENHWAVQITQLLKSGSPS